MVQIFRNNTVFKSIALLFAIFLSAHSVAFSQATTQSAAEGIVPTQTLDSNTAKNSTTQTLEVGAQPQSTQSFLTDNSSVMTLVKAGSAASQTSVAQTNIAQSVPANVMPIPPKIESELPQVTNKNTITIYGSKAMFTSIWVNGVRVVPITGTAYWTATLVLNNEGKNNFTIHAQNQEGRPSATTQISVTRDTAGPTGSVQIKNGLEYTANSQITLNLSAQDAGGVATMSFSNDGGITWTAKEAYKTTKVLSLASNEGKQVVQARFFDKAGNVSAVYSDSIMRDTQPPSGAIAVNGGAQYTNKTTVTLNLSAEDASGIKAMRFSRDGGKTWTEVEAFSTTKEFSLIVGDGKAAYAALLDGNKNIQVKFQDNSGKWSGSLSTTVILDRAPPIITVSDLPKNNQTDIPYLLIPYEAKDLNGGTVKQMQIVDLQPGMNKIVLTAKDFLGNEAKQIILIEYKSVDSKLSPEEKVLRDQYLRENFAYFTSGQGIDESTGFPIDLVGADQNPSIRWSQPTSIGFYISILGEVISKRLVIPGFSQEDALAAATKTIASLRAFQTNYGWRGLIPWIKIDGGVRPDRDEIAFIDNANLTAQIASFLGTLEKGNLQQGSAAAVYFQAKAFIDAQKPGYQAFVDSRVSGTGTFYSTLTFNKTKPQLPVQFSLNNHAESFGSEVRGIIPFLVQYYALPATVWTNLKKSVSSYVTQQGQTVKTFSAFDGGAFQYFWSLFTSPEESLPKISGALQNALTIFSDFMKKNNLTGFPSAASVPGGYVAQAGINALKESSSLQDQMIGAVYALASAYRLNPSLVLSQMAQLEKIPGLKLKGTLGFFDSSKNGTVSQTYYAIDQGALMLGLLGTGADNMRGFLEKRNLWTGYQSLYAGLNLNIT